MNSGFIALWESIAFRSLATYTFSSARVGARLAAGAAESERGSGTPDMRFRLTASMNGEKAPAEKTPYTIEIKRVLGSNATFTVPVDFHLESICVVNRRSSEILPYGVVRPNPRKFRQSGFQTSTVWCSPRLLI